ncbi:TetR/AcrR family transcriptional regulator [Halobacillus sp. ACCC02827]|uniref:TetR/AcrR family transcriptional regulator n=1 Tax=Halobacillus sp. ACCC02827 TaxID=3052090 RepID=UPI0025707D43|nr:TetR/AcrR family transcriptional regulator [Halobacillus sp. ACCC02827]WJE14026.1 TetR/AcrR family transcriptional regulator [Halobacillus sp. ACCC02827]
MGRKRALTQEEIFKVTGEVMRTEGIKGIHFKKLATMLDVSRSTFYDYFENKEALILAYMKAMMDEMESKISEIPADIAPNQKLYRLLIVLLEHAEVHHIDQMIRELQSGDKSLTFFIRTEVHQNLMETYKKMLDWINASKEEGIWNHDVDTELLGDLIFHSILFPQREKLGVKKLADQLFHMLERGVLQTR